MPSNAVPFHEFQKGGTRGLFEVIGVHRQISAAKAFERVSSHGIVKELEELCLVAINGPAYPAKCYEVVTNEGS